MGVTAIKSIANQHQSETYFVRNHEHPSDTGGPKGSLPVGPNENLACDMWIPWCTSHADFNAGHKISMTPIALNVYPVTFTIWQDGDYVRYSKDGQFHANGDLVPGNSTINGDRSVEITGTSLFDAELRFY